MIGQCRWMAGAGRNVGDQAWRARKCNCCCCNQHAAYPIPLLSITILSTYAYIVVCQKVLELSGDTPAMLLGLITLIADLFTEVPLC